MNKKTAPPQKDETQKDKGRRRLRVAIVVLLLIIIILILLLLTKCGGSEIPGRQDRDPNASVGMLEGKSPEEIQAELNRVVEEGMFNISINPSILFENGSAPGDLRIENIPANRYLMKVEITLDDTGEVVYTSGIIEPNYHIQAAPLDVPLAPGSYNATATFTALDPDTEQEAGQAAAKVVLTVNS